MHSTIGQIKGSRLRADLEAGLKEGALLPDGYQPVDQLFVRAPRDLIKDVMPSDGSVMVDGQSGVGKSTIMISQAVSLAIGEDWFGRRVRGPTGILYVCGEGYSGITRRFAAELQHRNIDKPIPLIVAKNTLDLCNEQQFRRFLNEQSSVSAYFASNFDCWLQVTIVDTLIANFPMKDENSNAEAAAICQRMKRSAEHTRGVFCGVHHRGKNADTGPRGASAYKAGMDQVVSVLGERDENTGKITNRRIVVTKSRDGAEGLIGNFGLSFVELGTDDFGEPFGAVIAEQTEAPAGGASGSRSKPIKSHGQFHAAFDDALKTHSREHRVLESSDIPSPTVYAVPLEAVRLQFNRRWATTETDQKKREDAARKAFKRVLEGISNYGTEVIRGEELIWRT